MPTKPSVQCVNGLELVGFLRFVLATSVALFHIWTTAFPDAGRHAVVGFFCVSGFLVTKIATESYNNRPLAFLLNRALRIFPTYWACLAIAVTIGIPFDETSKQLPYFSAAWPETAGGWVNNITLFRLAPDATKLISQAWSLEVELYFYFVIGLCTYRSFLLTVTCLLFTLVYAVFAISKLTLYPFYWTPYGVGFAFFAGSFAYFMSSRIALGWRAIIASATLYAVMMYCLPLIASFWQCFSILHRHQRGGRHGATNGTAQRIGAKEWHRQNLSISR